jgi:hypothetical protein
MKKHVTQKSKKIPKIMDFGDKKYQFFKNLFTN